MIEIKNINYKPSIEEIMNYIENPLFGKLYEYMNSEYKAICNIEYSKDVWLQGWNVKFKKAGKSLCVVYPKEKYFTVLVVVGKKEKERVEKILGSLSEEVQEIYNNTKEGMGQRWLMIEVKLHSEIYEDILKLIKIRRENG